MDRMTHRVIANSRSAQYPRPSRVSVCALYFLISS